MLAYISVSWDDGQVDEEGEGMGDLETMRRNMTRLEADKRAERYGAKDKGGRNGYLYI